MRDAASEVWTHSIESQVSFTLNRVLGNERTSILRFVGVPGATKSEFLRGTIPDVTMQSEAESSIRHLS
jgi:hypothetical protein